MQWQQGQRSLFGHILLPISQYRAVPPFLLGSATASLTPILRTVMDVQDFDGLSFHQVDNDVGQRRQHEFSRAGALAESAPVGCWR